MSKVIKLETALQSLKDEFYDDFKQLLDDNQFFIYFKDKKMYVFNEYSYPKVNIFEEKIFYKILKSKKLSDEELKLYHSIINDLKDISKRCISTENSLKGFVDRESRKNIQELRINLSNYCTLNCKYCFQKNKNTHKLSVEDCYSIIDDFLKENKDLTSIKVTMCMTSEPLLDIELIKKVYFYLQKKCLEKLKKETSKEELFNFLNIKTDDEYNAILTQKDYFKSAFSNMDERFISESLKTKLSSVLYTSDIDEIKSINEEVIYSALSSSKNMYYMWFCTNGTVLPKDQDLEFIKSLFTRDNLGISLDGNFKNSKNRVFTNGNPSYNTVIKNIKAFQKKGINLEVHCTITKDNNDFLKLIKFYKKLGIENICFSIEKGVYDEKIIKNIVKVFKAYKSGKIDKLYGLDVYKKLCENNFSVFTNCTACTYDCIGYDKKHYFCDYFVTKGVSLDEKKLKPLSVLNRKSCQNCNLKLLCGGTCLALTDGENDIHPESCKFKRNFIEQTIFYFC